MQVNFGRWPEGAGLRLNSLTYDSGMTAIGGMMAETALPARAAFTVLELHIDGSRNVVQQLAQKAESSLHGAFPPCPTPKHGSLSALTGPGVQPYAGHDDLGHQRPSL